MKPIFLTRYLISLCLMYSVFFSSQSLAQIAEDESTVTYPASYFAEYAPVNAKDMLDRIPGVGSTTGGGPSSSGGGFRGGGGGRGGRGFGSGSGSSEILINGKRTAGKNNQTSAVLSRITTEQVNYIQIIRGTSGELDVRGSGQVINVVLFEELSDSSMSYQINADRNRDGNIAPGANLSYSNRIGGFEYVLSAVAEPRYGHRESVENSILGDFSANDRVVEDSITKQTSYDLTANLGYEISDRSSARLNILLSQNDNPTKTKRNITNLKVSPNSLERLYNDIPGEQDNWEIGGDYETFLGNGDRFKILFVLNQDNRDRTRERFEIFSDGSAEKNLFLESGSVTEEEIIRSSYTRSILEGQDIEFGFERAVTTLDSNLAIGTLDPTGTPSPNFGGLVQISVPGSNSTVEEVRYEPFLIHNWVINPKVSLESTLLYEQSEITQSGDVSNKRDFNFLKPKVDLRYDLTPSIQLRGSIEKIVEQLRFSDFVADTDSGDEDSNVVAGNSEIRQEWYWSYNFNAEYRLPNDIGVIDGQIFYHDHRDKIERLDVSLSEDNLQSANGNIGDGKMYGISLNSSIRMRMFDMPNLLVSTSLSLSDSEITDPFTGQSRRMLHHGRGRASMSFRHDIPRLSLNWGASIRNSFDGGTRIFDIDDLLNIYSEPGLSLFAEWISPSGTSWRWDARDVGNPERCSDRTRFVGRLSAGILEEIEKRCSIRGMVMSLKITGTF
ncbi:MAG: TonB-dependent receptor plug domain-containing protein [Gammaproteobacteria bacterium]|nr:TonB-dependent receptor plug domain-containing protein [Gammaproteobacteria bacterium]